MSAEKGPRSVDVLSQVAEAFRLRGSCSGVIGVSPPFGFAMPRSDHASLFVLTRGRVYFELEGGKRGALELAPGDVVALPHGHAFTVRDSPGTPVRSVAEIGGCSGPRHHVAPGAQTEFVGLRCELAGGRANPMLRVLPPLIHCPGNDGRVARWLEPTVRLLTVESASSTPGRTTVLDRLAEVVFIQLIRSWVEGLPPGKGGWLRALSDPQLSSVLEAIHSEPGKSWSLVSLAERANMSRSAFAVRFKQVIGETPLEYLTRWRMQRATDLLETSEAPLKEIVSTSGYASEAAFRTAFRRWIGESPASYRNRARAV